MLSAKNKIHDNRSRLDLHRDRRKDYPLVWLVFPKDCSPSRTNMILSIKPIYITGILFEILAKFPLE